MSPLLLPGDAEFTIPTAETLESVTLEIERRIETMIRLARTKCCDLGKCAAATFWEQVTRINEDRKSPDAYLDDVAIMGVAVHAEEFFELQYESSLRDLLDQRYRLLATSTL